MTKRVRFQQDQKRAAAQRPPAALAAFQATSAHKGPPDLCASARSARSLLVRFPQDQKRTTPPTRHGSFYGPGGNPAGGSRRLSGHVGAQRSTGPLCFRSLCSLPPCSIPSRTKKGLPHRGNPFMDLAGIEPAATLLWTWRESNPRPKASPSKHLPSQPLLLHSLIRPASSVLPDSVAS